MSTSWSTVYDCPKLTDSGICAFHSSCPRFETIFLANCPKIGNENTLEALGRCTNLRKIGFHDCPKLTGDALLNLVKSASRVVDFGVTSVDVTRCPGLTDESVMVRTA